MCHLAEHTWKQTQFGNAENTKQSAGAASEFSTCKVKLHCDLSLIYVVDCFSFWVELFTTTQNTENFRLLLTGRSQRHQWIHKTEIYFTFADWNKAKNQWLVRFGCRSIHKGSMQVSQLGCHQKNGQVCARHTMANEWMVLLRFVLFCAGFLPLLQRRLHFKALKLQVATSIGQASKSALRKGAMNSVR